MNNHDSIESMNDENSRIVLELFIELGNSERHFNELESRYRSLASTWLLATFAGIGFVISEPIDISFDRLLAITGIGIAGSIGIMFLWNLDLMVYHKLLNAVFIEGLKLEEKYEWLPAVRTNMRNLHGGTGVEPRVVWFYIGGTSVLLMISGLALALWLHKFDTIFVIIEALVYLLTILYIGRKLSQTTSTFKSSKSELDKYKK